MKYVDIKAVLQLARSITSDAKTLTSNAEELRARLSALEGTFHDDGFDEVNAYSKSLVSRIAFTNDAINSVVQQLIQYAELLQLGKGSNGTPAHSAFTSVSGLDSNRSNVSKPSSVFPHNNSKTSTPSNNDSGDKWNGQYLPLVKANIRNSMDRIFPGIVSPEKIESSLSALRFVGPDDMQQSLGKEYNPNILGYNDSFLSFINQETSGNTRDSTVGDHRIQGSRGADIKFAFVTAVHENLHMMSANGVNRGIMTDGNESARAMNEAITEYFTYLSCGGDTKLGGLYPGEYSAYHVLVREMPKLEKAVGRSIIATAYFHNKPEVLRNAVDSLLGDGTWQLLCTSSYGVLYSETPGYSATIVLDIFNRLEQASSNY